MSDANTATPAAKPRLGPLRVLGLVLVAVAALSLYDALTMDTTIDQSPSMAEASAMIAAGLEPQVRQVVDPELANRQILYGIIGAGALVAGAVLIARRP